MSKDNAFEKREAKRKLTLNIREYITRKVGWENMTFIGHIEGSSSQINPMNTYSNELVFIVDRTGIRRNRKQRQGLRRTPKAMKLKSDMVSIVRNEQGT